MLLNRIAARVTNKVFRTFNYTVEKLPADNTNREDFERLIKSAAKANDLKLHFGCGARILKDWINIDLAFTPFEPYLQYYTDKHYPPEIRGTREDLFIVNMIKDGLPLPDNSVDIIFHEDFFEHLSQKAQFIFLAETFRVMKPGAVHRINTPNIRASMRDNSSFDKGKDGVFTSEWDTWHHDSIISPAILKEMSQIVGYSEIQFNAKDKSIIQHLLPPEYRPNENDRLAADSNVFADLIK